MPETASYWSPFVRRRKTMYWRCWKSFSSDRQTGDGVPRRISPRFGRQCRNSTDLPFTSPFNTSSHFSFETRSCTSSVLSGTLISSSISFEDSSVTTSTTSDSLKSRSYVHFAPSKSAAAADVDVRKQANSTSANPDRFEYICHHGSATRDG